MLDGRHVLFALAFGLLAGAATGASFVLLVPPADFCAVREE